MVTDESLKGNVMVIPIVCETVGCPNEGKIINAISEIAPEDLDMFLEDFDTSQSSNTEDYCLLCGKQGTAYEPENLSVLEDEYGIRS